MASKGCEYLDKITTDRLFLREMNPDDFQALFRVLGDPEIMGHYPYTFDRQRVRDWIERNMNRYRKDGYGLWAVCLKNTGEMIGDCGLTLQCINGETLPEIGFHIRRDCQRKGYAKEAARAVRDWAFQNTDYPALYSYCKYTNEPSFRTAEAIGMHFACEYPDEINGKTHVSMIIREEWLSEENQKEVDNR
jgi:RimJ/RimL family protein N-acetyltransferase